MLFGFAFAAEVWWMPLLVLALLFFYYPPAIEYEDRKLKSIFGSDWEKWHEQNSALIPILPPSGKIFTPWSFRQSLLGNGEPIIVAFAIYCSFELFMRLS
jgi:hypothetical protein